MKVFKVLWSEPQGSGRDRKTIQDLTEKGVRDNEYGEKFHVGFRRFIVVAMDEGHSTCVYAPSGTSSWFVVAWPGGG